MSAFTSRCLMNWLPIASKIRAEGGTCDFRLFPRLSDPDHTGLYGSDIQSHVVLTAPINSTFELCETTEAECIAAIQRQAEAL
jgi:hypothetical protein